MGYGGWRLLHLETARLLLLLLLLLIDLLLVRLHGDLLVHGVLLLLRKTERLLLLLLLLPYVTNANCYVRLLLLRKELLLLRTTWNCCRLVLRQLPLSRCLLLLRIHLLLVALDGKGALKRRYLLLKSTAVRRDANLNGGASLLLMLKLLLLLLVVVARVVLVRALTTSMESTLLPISAIAAAVRLRLLLVACGRGLGWKCILHAESICLRRNGVFLVQRINGLLCHELRFVTNPRTPFRSTLMISHDLHLDDVTVRSEQRHEHVFGADRWNLTHEQLAIVWVGCTVGCICRVDSILRQWLSKERRAFNDAATSNYGMVGSILLLHHSGL